MSLKDADGTANSVDLDQTAPSDQLFKNLGSFTERQETIYTSVPL